MLTVLNTRPPHSGVHVVSCPDP